jgi:hypothetical protein
MHDPGAGFDLPRSDGVSSIVLDGGAEVPCEEKTRLAMEYEAATSVFSGAVKELRRKIGTSPKEEYKRLERNLDRSSREVRASKTGA